MPIGDLLSEIATGVPSPTTSYAPNNDFRRPVEKPKRLEPQTANSSRPISDPRRDVKNLSNKPSGSRPVASTSMSQPKPVAPTGPPAPPKKGSFAEIMARGVKAQETLGKVGTIQHKKIEKPPSRREREEKLAQKTRNIKEGLKPSSKFQKIGQPTVREMKKGVSGGTSSKLGKTSKTPVELEKKVKKAATATTGYTGTARPKPGGSSSSKPGLSGSARRERDRLEAKRSSSAHYAYASEDDMEEEDEIEGDDYASDASSDMEAAAFEVDEEEDRATRIARQEDAEALREENRLKMEKLEKKRKLEAMAKKAPAPRY